mmetsp:Transcript_19948/g.50657  ORF Transcript_19948/g.50657 Transcript_19948/m.50657 type:complete len:224 (+) Transcript_19948:1026-1697(+)
MALTRSALMGSQSALISGWKSHAFSTEMFTRTHAGSAALAIIFARRLRTRLDESSCRQGESEGEAFCRLSFLSFEMVFSCFLRWSFLPNRRSTVSACGSSGRSSLLARQVDLVPVASAAQTLLMVRCESERRFIRRDFRCSLVRRDGRCSATGNIVCDTFPSLRVGIRESCCGVDGSAARAGAPMLASARAGAHMLASARAGAHMPALLTEVGSMSRLTDQRL